MADEAAATARAPVSPTTPEERQACATVAATRQVYDEIEAIASILKEDWRPLPERVEAKHALLQASERLCNLMGLAIYQIDNNISGALRTQLQGNLDALRDRLMGLGARLMVEKLEKIDKRAASVLQEQDYPIGLAGKLDMMFANLMVNLKVLGGAERFGEQVPDLVTKTETDLKSLGDMERRLGVMREVPAARPRNR